MSSATGHVRRDPHRVSARLGDRGDSLLQRICREPDLRNGTNPWWVDENSLIDGWTEPDAALRATEGKKPVSDTGAYPLAILTRQNIPSGTGIPVEPANCQSDFKKPWHVG
jgi:hypothetical protein